MDQAIQDFFKIKQIAVVGVSRKPEKFCNMALKELKARGFEVYPVHPLLQEIDGVKCSPNLAALNGKTGRLLVSVPPQSAIHVLQDAAAAGIRNIWLQQGAESPEVLTKGRQLGLNVISGKCILMYAPPVKSFHMFHGWVMKLIGKY